MNLKAQLKTDYNKYVFKISRASKREPRRFWSFANSKKSAPRQRCFKINDDVTSNSNIIANAFASHFKSVFSTDIPDYSFPQGSLLGNVFFSIMIDGITQVISHSYFLLYADDLKIFKPISNLQDMFLLQQDLYQIQNWLSLNSLSFCPQKCEVAVFCRRLFHRINGFYPSYPENIAYLDLRENLNLCSVENGQKKILLQFLYKVLNNNIDSIQLIQDIPFQVPLSLTRNINNVQLFKIPKATTTQLSPIFKALTLYNIHHHSQLDLFSILKSAVLVAENGEEYYYEDFQESDEEGDEGSEWKLSLDKTFDKDNKIDLLQYINNLP
ncbi:hypothetical protein M8J77_000504 [Diaphorina citri]|nr:hypothetical protein M8J77_000504 [Diaphorina citri]